jgi:hypothetical protein
MGDRDVKDAAIRTPTGRRPVCTCLALAVALLIASAGAATASLFLDFDRTSGRPGTVVHVHTVGDRACGVCPRRMPLYFAEAAISDGITSPDDSRLLHVGRLTVDDLGRGSGVITVPEVESGRYMVMTYCKPCATSSAGRVILPLGPFPPFRVFDSSTDASPQIWPWLVGGLLVVLAATALLWSLPRRRARSGPGS